MKSVLISIRPKWCELIARGEKTLEVRKTRPKLETPFKCYIYCTKSKDMFWVFDEISRRVNGISAVCAYLKYPEGASQGNGKIIGEFICDRIYQYTTSNLTDGVDITTDDVTRMSCLTKQELEACEFSTEPKDFCLYMVGLYCWHISNLKIYDKPKELSDYIGIKTMRDGFEVRVLERPPQSWCYVEEI